MIEEVGPLIERFNLLAREARKYCYIARSLDGQAEAGNKLGVYVGEVQEAKRKAIAAEEEDSANMLLGLEAASGTLASELKMWQALKTDKPDAAWEHLIDAQTFVQVAVASHPSMDHLKFTAKRLSILEKCLFPPQMFTSTGMVIESAECSICREEYGECNHVKGRVYIGQMCTRIVTRVKELREVSYVDEPADKRCRVERVTADGITRNWMSWSVTGDAPSVDSSAQREPLEPDSGPTS